MSVRLRLVAELQAHMTRVIMKKLLEAGLVGTHLWSKDHVLEVVMHNRDDYDSAMELMRMECPTEASSLFGMPDHESGYLLVFQFDNI